MTRSELVRRLAAANPHLFRRDVERIVATLFETMAATLEEGGRIELRGFGVMDVRERPARTARNPRTGALVEVPPRRTVRFRPGKELRARLGVGEAGASGE